MHWTHVFKDLDSQSYKSYKKDNMQLYKKTYERFFAFSKAIIFALLAWLIVFPPLY